MRDRRGSAAYAPAAAFVAFQIETIRSWAEVNLPSCIVARCSSVKNTIVEVFQPGLLCHLPGALHARVVTDVVDLVDLDLA